MRHANTLSISTLTLPFLTAAMLATSPALAGGEACRAAAAAAAAAEAPQTETIDLVICLDTSGSMNGLIDAARAKIWDIVSDLAMATPTPKLRVALLTYGNDGLLPENGWTNVEIDLSEDLDAVSQRLFALTTNGGTEFVGRVVDRATKALTWSPAERSLRILVVAGNEGADQDQEVRYQDACKRAIEQGILVNSIYCGAPTDAQAPGWKDVATLADGHFATIDQNNGTVIVETPFDADLVVLNDELNRTYVAYGAWGTGGATNQALQDANAAGVSSAVAAQRCSTKGSQLYDNRQWDLVDACKQTDFTLETLKDEDLPEEMRGMDVEARRAYIEAKTAERTRIQARIGELSVKRNQFVAEETAKRADGDKAAFDRAIRDAIRAQATARGFAFPAEPVAPVAAPVAAPASASASAG